MIVRRRDDPEVGCSPAGFLLAVRGWTSAVIVVFSFSFFGCSPRLFPAQFDASAARLNHWSCGAIGGGAGAAWSWSDSSYFVSKSTVVLNNKLLQSWVTTDRLALSITGRTRYLLDARRTCVAPPVSITVGLKEGGRGQLDFLEDCPLESPIPSQQQQEDARPEGQNVQLGLPSNSSRPCRLLNAFTSVLLGGGQYSGREHGGISSCVGGRTGT